ncbi:helix-turn-helix transcriptional regulator [Arthrobacter sp. efr-133-TYG-120]|uniref:helix-turn-helix domain-containing protein n=1 Tax=Arthrobacter sp. efr-133-TYG-120 TaxID=3040280 RepID=UPI00254DE1BA|nr:helix-turn-helix transcriptional regulator [Arthrobacter sp. efr-133-TYG-120]
MTEDSGNEWMKRTAAAIGARVRQAREENGMSVQGLADACTALGYKMLRTTLVNLEAGARKNITVGELSVIAAALGTGPLALIVPLGEDQTIEVLPGRHAKPWGAWKWFSNEGGSIEGERFGIPSLREENIGDRVFEIQGHFRQLELFWTGYDSVRDQVREIRDVRLARGLPDESAEAYDYWMTEMDSAIAELRKLGVSDPELDDETIADLTAFRARRAAKAQTEPT